MDKEKPILIYSANGVQGGAVVRQAIKRGYRVRALVRNAEKSTRLKELGVEIVEADLQHAEKLRDAYHGSDYVVLQIPLVAPSQMELFVSNAINAIQANRVKKREADWRGKLAAWAGAALNAYIDSIFLHNILFYGPAPPSREGLFDNILVDHLIDLLQTGQGSGAWTIDDTRFTAVFLFNGLHGIVEAGYVEKKGMNRTRMVRELAQLYLSAVGLVAPQ